MTTITVGWVALSWSIFVTVCGVGATILSMWGALRFATRKSVEDLSGGFSTAQAEQDKRLASMEEQLRQAPKHSDLTLLSAQVGALGKDVARLEGQTERSNNLLEAIHDHLLNEK